MKGRTDVRWNWQGPRLYIGTKTVAVIVPDTIYADMWRVRRADGSLSDMANLTRARDAAIAMVLRDLNTGITASEAPTFAQRGRARHERQTPGLMAVRTIMSHLKINWPFGAENRIRCVLLI